MGLGGGVGLTKAGGLIKTQAGVYVRRAKCSNESHLWRVGTQCLVEIVAVAIRRKTVLE